VQIALPLAPGRVRFQIPGGTWVEYDAAIVAPDQPHAFEARGLFMATLFVEPESRDGHALRLGLGERGIAPVDRAALPTEIAALAAAYQRDAGDAELIALTQSTIRRLAHSAPMTNKLGDARVGQAVELIRARLSGTVSLRDIAAAVHLSPDRFRHLFLEETGVALRPYVLWLRLETALAAYVGGSSLTDAAFAAGFADSAHFSRTFKRMFGIAPASVRPE
jgi:AraC-like DNA-binding protein